MAGTIIHDTAYPPQQLKREVNRMEEELEARRIRMSKMGAEFEKNLDKYKYDLYEALERVKRDLDKWGDVTEMTNEMVAKALNKVEGLTNKK